MAWPAEPALARGGPLCLLARGRPLYTLPSRRAVPGARAGRRSLAGKTASRPPASWPASPAPRS